MPLLDHFTEPVDPRAEWPSFHIRWANEVANELDRVLPGHFRVRLEVHHPDVEPLIVSPSDPPLPPPTSTAEIHPGDTIAVEVHDLHGRLGPAAVVMLVCPSNKANPQARTCFVAACHARLSQGAGVVVVDTVTDPATSLLRGIVDFNSPMGATLLPDPIYAAAFRPAYRDGKGMIDCWTFPLAVGQPLPTMPLYIRAHEFLPLDLERSYTETRQNCRLP